MTSDEGDIENEPKTETGTGTAAESGDDAIGSASGDADAEADTGTEASPEAASGTDAGPVPDSDSEPDPDSGTDAEPEPVESEAAEPEPAEREFSADAKAVSKTRLDNRIIEPEAEPATRLDNRAESRRRVSSVYFAPDSVPPRPAPAGSDSAGFGPSEPSGPSGKHRRRRKALIGAIAGVAVVLVAAGVAFVVLRGPSAGFHPTAGNPRGDAEQLANAFVQDWSTGDLSGAASLTDNPVAAMQALERYQSGLHLQHLTGSAQSAVAVRAPAAPAGTATTGAAAATTLENVTYLINATVSSGTSSGAAGAAAKPVSGVWPSHPVLTAYQQAGGSGWFIQWKPDAIAPNLTADEHLGVTTVAPTVLSVTDSGGDPLSSYSDPSLAHIATDLETDGVPAGQGVPGLDVEVENAKGKLAPGTGRAVVTSPQNIAALKTTIDPTAERAAIAAVQAKPGSSMVAIQPSTGHILAIANNDGQEDSALIAREAPGSDFKIVTSTALFNNHIITANSSVACPSQILGIGNNDNETEPAGTPFTTDFAASCNNAFTQWYPRLEATSGSGSSAKDLLASTAGQYYGLNKNWDIGIGNQSAQYFTMPDNGGAGELAEEAFGQGQLAGEPLAMASVVATVANGSFEQPILVPGTKQITATPLPASTQEQLKTCMRAVITNPQGTAYGMGFGPTVYGKTGTATVAGQANPNAWFVAFDSSKNIALATMVINGGYGAAAAAPEVEAVLGAYGG
ncbi:MAG TPA: penicillin-binding transpeptidase domain-containing protein [Trebonia sp.]